MLFFHGDCVLWASKSEQRLTRKVTQSETFLKWVIALAMITQLLEAVLSNIIVLSFQESEIWNINYKSDISITMEERILVEAFPVSKE